MLEKKSHVRPISDVSEMEFFINQAQREGWNPGLCDALPFYHTDPNGFFICTVDNQIIGCISVVAYNADFAFLGFYIVLPDFRRKGYGASLLQAGCSYAGDRNIGLDGVVDQRKTYEKTGFKKAHCNVRYASVGKKANGSRKFCSIMDIPFETIVQYDRQYFPVERRSFLRNWFDMPNNKSFGLYENGKLRGYGVIRECLKWYKIGPLFADNAEIANDLFIQLSSTAAGKPIYLDIPEINMDAQALVKEHHMEKVFETIRMYTKGVPDFEMKKVFGITTFELG